MTADVDCAGASRPSEVIARRRVLARPPTGVEQGMDVARDARMTLTVGQAVRNAVEAERAAAKFYRALAALDLSPEVESFFLAMAKQEDQHAESIEVNGKRLVDGELPERADMAVRNVEAAPEWLVADSISKDSAISIARDNEYKAALFYDALADFCPEPEAEFFRQLAKTELEHAKRLENVTL